MRLSDDRDKQKDFVDVTHNREFVQGRGWVDIEPTESISSNWVISKRTIEESLSEYGHPKLDDKEFEQIMFDFSEYCQETSFFKWFFLTFYQGSYTTPSSRGHKDENGKMKTSNFIVGGG